MIDIQSKLQVSRTMPTAIRKVPENLADTAGQPNLAPNHEIRVQSCTSFDEPPVGREEWDRFVLESGSDLYFSFDWCRLWWEHYSAGRMLQLLAFRAGDRLVGLMPMIIDRVGLLGARARLAKFVGSDSTITVLQPAIATGWHKRIVAATITHLITAERCDAVWFGPLSGEGGCAEAFRSACADHPHGMLVRDKSLGVHSVFLLPDTFDKYLASLDKKPRYNYQRASKQLASGRTVVHSLVTQPDQARASFDAFVQMHARQWNAVNQPGHFGDWPHSEEFTRDVVEQLAPLGRVVFMHLIADDVMLTREHSFVFGRHLHWRLPARDLGAEWDKLSIGNIALVRSIKTAIEYGMNRIEAGPGYYDGKARYGATDFPLASLLVVRHGVGPRIRARLLCAKADLLHLLYYRVWRIRLAPRIVRRQQPLWKCWIRSRI